MSSLKEFLDRNGQQFEQGDISISKKKLGLFFWERGGKQLAEYLSFIKEAYGWEGTFENIVKEANRLISDYKMHYGLMDSEDSYEIMLETSSQARDFLDCLDCLGEKKVKELIKELEEEKE
jgi:hypothetical protein